MVNDDHVVPFNRYRPPWVGSPQPTQRFPSRSSKSISAQAMEGASCPRVFIHLPLSEEKRSVSVPIIIVPSSRWVILSTFENGTSGDGAITCHELFRKRASPPSWP